MNALLELENSLKANAEEQTEKEQLDSDCDSLDKDDGHVYENMEGASLRQPEIVNNVSEDAEEPEETLNVHDLKNKFEEKCAKIKEAESKNGSSIVIVDVLDKDRSLAEVSSSQRLEEEDLSKDEETKTEPGVGTNSLRSRRTYEKDGLPPCLRARNLKMQHKTRSLDENEFEKEFAVSNPRRKSFDERIG